jgi:hypothetical protein
VLTNEQPRSEVGDPTVAGPGPRPAPTPSPAPPRRRLRDDTRAAFGFLAPALLTFLVFVLAPTVGVLILSFSDWNLLSDGEFVGFDNFTRLFSDQRLLDVYGSTAYMAVIILVINVVLGLLLAVLLEARMPRWLRGFFRLSFLENLIKEGVSPAPMPMSDVFTRFQNGQIAMFGAGRWPIATFLPKFKNFDIQLYPKGDTYKTVFGGAGYPILKSSKNPDLAWEYQKFTVSAASEQQYVGTADKPGDSIPSLRSVAQTISKVGVPPANSDLFYDSIDKYPTLVPYPAPAKYSAFESTVLRHLQLIFAGEKSVSDGLKDMQAELSTIVTC